MSSFVSNQLMRRNLDLTRISSQFAVIAWISRIQRQKLREYRLRAKRYKEVLRRKKSRGEGTNSEGDAHENGYEDSGSNPRYISTLK